ncbi:muramidase [Streptomyces yokosukanensis]|uniref:Muramidase n=1 Tax=Streptomyces yokosukanensis TaxID=67386 RepID=A0A101NT27_9ACTN|nr:glycoside hydrolase family 25 protein [Streptomyces yokosukanensis]KUM98746.1 muramidase [Streptomyces yokosukanensis]
MSTKGIDVSSIQSETYDVKGLDFVFIKITEGHSYTNPKWVAQRKTARNAGLVTGFYHFARPGPFEVQADYFLSQINLVDGDILALDWEDPGISGAWKDAWIRRVQKKAPGHKVILYCDRDFWLNRDTTSFAGDGLWIAQYNGHPGRPDIEHSWVFHQYSAQPVDKDLGNFKDKAELVAWC